MTFCLLFFFQSLESTPYGYGCQGCRTCLCYGSKGESVTSPPLDNSIPSLSTVNSFVMFTGWARYHRCAWPSRQSGSDGTRRLAGSTWFEGRWRWRRNERPERRSCKLQPLSSYARSYLYLVIMLSLMRALLRYFTIFLGQRRWSRISRKSRNSSKCTPSNFIIQCFSIHAN